MNRAYLPRRVRGYAVIKHGGREFFPLNGGLYGYIASVEVAEGYGVVVFHSLIELLEILGPHHPQVGDVYGFHVGFREIHGMVPFYAPPALVLTPYELAEMCEAPLPLREAGPCLISKPSEETNEETPSP